MTTLPSVKLDRGIHVMHLFYRIDRICWSALAAGESARVLERFEAHCRAHAQPSHPRVVTYANVCGKADLAVMLYAAELGQLAQLHRDLEAGFPPGALHLVYSYLSVTELSEYMTTDEENRQRLIVQEKLQPDSEAFNARLAELTKTREEYEQYRLYPEMPDWEVMCFYPMNKRREGGDNWYALDFTARKKLMGGHARVGRKYAGRVTQLITGSTGIDDWEWGVTLMAHQTDALKEIVYEMRFDEVSARYGEFGTFYLNLRLDPGGFVEAPAAMTQFYEQLAAALAGTEPFALSVLSGIKGSSPQKQGAKALFFADGRIIGTLGGGCLEAEIQDRARRALRTGTPATFDLVLDHDFGWDDGLICGGKVHGLILPHAAQAATLWRELTRREVRRTWGVKNDFSIAWVDEEPAADWLYTETIFPPCPLWIAGSGHVAQAVAPLAARLDFAVTIFDDRTAFAHPQFFPDGAKFRIGPWEDLLRETPPATPTFGLIVTRGHQRDALVLARWIQQPFVFLGMIGSRRKKRLIFEQFRAEQIATAEQLQRVACPVGLEISSITVPEIAVSIAAQLITKRAEVLPRSASTPPAKATHPLQTVGPEA